MSIVNIKKGCLLVAETGLTGDISFSRSIILITEHNEEGSVGFILNKKSDFSLSDFLPDVELSDYEIFEGGPVNKDSLSFIHSVPHLIPDSVQIEENLFWGGNFKILLKQLSKGLIPKDKIKFFLGYSGWSSNQLNYEIEHNSWIVIDNYKDETPLTLNYKSIWRDELKKLGGDYLIWANSPEDPSHN